jgi:hypothetical protein
MAAVALMGASTALSIGSSLSARSSAKKEKKAQRKLNRLMTAEEIKRLGKENERVLGSAKAQIASSGFTGYGSNTEEYLDELQREQGRSIAFTAQVGANNANNINAQGQAQQNAYGMQALGSLIGGAGQVASAFDWGLNDGYTPTANVGGSQGGGSRRYSRGSR